MSGFLGKKGGGSSHCESIALTLLLLLRSSSYKDIRVGSKLQKRYGHLQKHERITDYLYCKAASAGI